MKVGEMQQIDEFFSCWHRITKAVWHIQSPDHDVQLNTCEKRFVEVGHKVGAVAIRPLNVGEFVGVGDVVEVPIRCRLHMSNAMV